MSLPSSKTIDRVIKAIMGNIELIFMQIINLCEAFDLIGKERAFIDGTKTKANASKHKAMSYGYLCDKIENNNGSIQDLIEKVIDKIELDDFENPDNEQLEKQILDEAQEIYKTAERIHQQQLKANQETIFSGQTPETTEERTTSLPPVPEGQTTIFEHIDPEDEKKINEFMYDI